MSRFTSIDLSELTPPPVVEELNYELILDAINGDLVERLLAAGVDYDVQGLESDPAIKVNEVTSYRETILRSRVNNAARAVMLAYAQGGDLDQLAAYYGVVRRVVTPADANNPAVMESDQSLRMRAQLAPEAFASAGPEGAYVFHTLGVDPIIKDAKALSPMPGHVHVLPLTSVGNGIPNESLLERVRARLHEKDIKPLTDIISVRAPVLTTFAVEAQLQIVDGPDKAVVLNNARGAALVYLATRHKVGMPVIRNGLIAALKVAGVEDLTLSPAESIAVPPDGVAYCTSLSVTAAA